MRAFGGLAFRYHLAPEVLVVHFKQRVVFGVHVLEAPANLAAMEEVSDLDQLHGKGKDAVGGQLVPYEALDLVHPYSVLHLPGGGIFPIVHGPRLGDGRRRRNLFTSGRRRRRFSLGWGRCGSWRWRIRRQNRVASRNRRCLPCAEGALEPVRTVLVAAYLDRMIAGGHRSVAKTAVRTDGAQVAVIDQ